MEGQSVQTVASQVQLVLGNYALAQKGTTVTASSEYSADYPAEGAIDGDRTEINMGAASTSENGVGLSTWMSAGTDPTAEYLTIDLGQNRTFNRIKVYQREGHGITYSVWYYSADYSDWVLLYTTSASPTNLGYGNNAYGSTPYGDPPEVATTYGVDVVDLGYDVTAQQIKIIGISTEVASDYFNIVEVEVYRVIDITTRTLSISTNFSQDYILQNDLVGEASIGVMNADKFFSPDYTPTAAEIANGFVNSELGAGITVIIKAGYKWSGAEQELVSLGVFNVDELNLTPKDRTASMTCRNQKGKMLMTTTTTSKVLYNKSIEDCFKYAVQFANIHPSECTFENTGLQVPLFFINNETVFTSLQTLITTLGTGRFFVDATDTPTLAWEQDLSTTLRASINAQAVYDRGSNLNNIDTISFLDSFTIGQSRGAFYSQNYTPEWSLVSNSNCTVGYDADNLLLKITQTDNETVGALTISLASTDAYGCWSFIIDGNSAYDSSTPAVIAGTISWDFILDSGGTNGYRLKIGPGNSATIPFLVTLCRLDSSVETVIGTAATLHMPTRLAIYRTGANAFILYRDETTPNTGNTLGTDATYTTSAQMYVNISLPVSSYLSSAYMSFGAMRFMSISGLFESDAIYAGANFSAWGNFYASYVNNGAYTSATFYYKTSTDGVSWGAYSAVVNGGAVTGSGPYIMLKVVLAGALGTDKPIISGMTITWTIAKTLPTPSPISVTDTGNMMDLQIAYVDTLAGDSSLYNDIKLTSQNYVTDSLWTDLWDLTLTDGTTTVTSDKPYAITASGTYTFTPELSNPATPESLVVQIAADTALGATATVSYKHTTNPIITVVCTGTGNIDSMSVWGRAINTTTTYSGTASDATSISVYGKKPLSISTLYALPYWAPTLAAYLLARYKNLVGYVKSLECMPIFRAQLDDTISWNERTTTDTAQTYPIVAIAHNIDVSGGTVNTTFELKKQ
jgi:hypothetical protein